MARVAAPQAADAGVCHAAWTTAARCSAPGRCAVRRKGCGGAATQPRPGSGQVCLTNVHLLSPRALPLLLQSCFVTLLSARKAKQRGCRRTVALHTQCVEDELTRRRAARLATAVGALSALVAVDAEAANALAAAAAQLPYEGLELLQAGVLPGSRRSPSRSVECLSL